MTLTDAILQTVETLSAEDQHKVLEFARALPPVRKSSVERINPMGMFAHLGIDLSLEDFQEARREAWANFPRPFPGEEAP
jgi:hypothetical protein